MSARKDQPSTNNTKKTKPQNPDFLLSATYSQLLAALAMGGIIVMRNSFDELGIRIEIMRNVIIWGVMYIAINGVRANQTNEWQPFLVVIQQMLLSYSMIVMPCHNTNNPLICGKSNQVTPIESSMSRSYNDSSGSASGSGNDSSRYSIGSQHSQLDSGLSMSFFNSGLESLLETDEGVNMFSRYCATEFSVENINFWLAVREFQLAAAASAAAAVVFRISERMNENEEDGEGEGDKMVVEEIGDDDLEKENDPDQNRPQQQNKPDPGQLSPAMRDEANEIFSEFVKIGSAMQVNLPSRLQKQIAKNVNEEKINADIFADGQKEIFSLMSRDSYQRFLKVNKKKLERAAKKKVHGASMGKFARKLSASPMRMGMGQ